jgi:hypothetical protein
MIVGYTAGWFPLVPLMAWGLRFYAASWSGTRGRGGDFPPCGAATAIYTATLNTGAVDGWEQVLVSAGISATYSLS